MPTAAADTIKLKEARSAILVNGRRLPKIVERLSRATLAKIKLNGLAVEHTDYIRGHHHSDTVSMDPNSRLAVLPWTMVAADAAGRYWTGTAPAFRKHVQHRVVATPQKGDLIGTGQKRSLLLWITSPVSPCASILQAGGYWQKENDTADPSS